MAAATKKFRANPQVARQSELRAAPSSAAERRAAQIASLSTQQAELKQEAAARRAARASQNAPAASRPHKAAAPRRSNSR
jgi:hypothetical protein